MKKIITVTLTLLLLLSAFAACEQKETTSAPESASPSVSGSETATETPSAAASTVLPSGDVSQLVGKTPEELYAETLEKMKGLTSYEVTAVQTITVSAEGQTVSQNQTVISKINGQNVYSKIDSEAAPSLNMECWYVDEMFYLVQGEVKAKASLTYEGFKKYMPEGSTADSALMNIPEAWFKDVAFKSGDDGLYYLEFIVSGAEYLQYFESSALKDTIAGVDEIGDITYTVNFDKDGNMNGVITVFDMTVQGMTANVYSKSTVTGINSTTIVAPENTESWTDVTGQV